MVKIPHSITQLISLILSLNVVEFDCEKQAIAEDSSFSLSKELMIAAKHWNISLNVYNSEYGSKKIFMIICCLCSLPELLLLSSLSRIELKSITYMWRWGPSKSNGNIPTHYHQSSSRPIYNRLNDSRRFLEPASDKSYNFPCKKYSNHEDLLLRFTVMKVSGFHQNQNHDMLLKVISFLKQKIP